MDFIFGVLVFGGYLLGALPFGILIMRLKGLGDPRQGGSGNIGATNVMRMAGKTAGIATLVLDIAKGAVPTLLGVIFLVPWQAAMVGLASFLGHIFPVFLRFKGGKGVATALGVWMILSPPAFLGVVALILFLAWRTGHMSAGSLAGCGSAPLWMIINREPWQVITVSIVMSAIIVFRHRENITRLIQGRENTIR